MTAYAPYVVAVVVAIVVELIGGWLTRLDSWYESLRKPAWQPPGFLFAPVWTILFLMIAIAAGMAWNACDTDRRPLLLLLFGVNAVLNIGWSGVFFRARRPDLAFFEVIVFLISIAALVAFIWPISQGASLLLLPYLAWVSFAAILNFTVARLNAYL